MDILGLSTSPGTGGAYALILSETDGKRRLPIIIGTFEAQAIALELENIKPPRPMTHDLMRNIIQSFNTYVKEICIHELKEGTFFAQIKYDNNGKSLIQDARPSDAIALAIRFNAPIFVSDYIVEEAGIEAEPKVEEEEEGTGLSGTAEPTASSHTSAKKTASSSKETQIRLLEKSLASAIAEENYEKAAKIRDELNRLRE